MHRLPIPEGPIYATVFWISFVLWIAPEVIASIVKRSEDPSRIHDQGSLNRIMALWTAGIVSDILLSLMLPQAAMPSDQKILFAIGICLMLLGIGLRWYSAGILGKYFTFDVAVQGGQALIETGPYRHVRHPSYAGALLTLVGFGLVLGNWAGLAVSLSCLGYAYADRIPIEERALASELGEAYTQYMKRTWRLIPYVF